MRRREYFFCPMLFMLVSKLINEKHIFNLHPCTFHFNFNFNMFGYIFLGWVFHFLLDQNTWSNRFLFVSHCDNQLALPLYLLLSGQEDRRIDEVAFRFLIIINIILPKQTNEVNYLPHVISYNIYSGMWYYSSFLKVKQRPIMQCEKSCLPHHKRCFIEKGRSWWSHH